MTRQRIRVLHVVNNLHYGGMERVIAELVRRTDASQFEVHVAVLKDFGHFSAEMRPYATLHLASPMTRLSMLHPAALASDIRRIAPHVVHTHSGSWFKGSLAARLAGVPFQVYTDHGRQVPDPWMYRKLDYIASRRTDVVVAVSDKLAHHMASFVADPNRIRVVPNGVDTDAAPGPAPSESLRAELNVAPDAPIIGSVGRLEPVKGYEVMVAGFALLLRQWQDGPPPVLVLVGDGSEKERLVVAARDAGIASSVRFVGWRSDIQRCLASFTIFAMTSHSEGTSVSLLEAMSAALCPVVTDVGGNSAVLGMQLRHRLIPPGNPPAFAAACREALSPAESCASDAAAARLRVVETFGLDSMVRSYENIYMTAEPHV